MKNQTDKKIYRHACLGGTFDNLHTGHKSLITQAFHKADFVSIGVSIQSLKTDKQFIHSIQDFDTRKAKVLQFIEQHNWQGRASVFPIHDIYGPTITDQTIDMLIVTRETRTNAQKINAIRKKYGLPTCKLIVVPYVKDRHKHIISSTRIRAGETDSEGNRYVDIFSGKNKYYLPGTLRESLREPLGVVVAGHDNEIENTGKKAASFIAALAPPLLISVGDIATESLQNAGCTPHISVIDFKTRRTHLVEPHEIPKNGYVVNLAGSLCLPAVNKIHQAIKHFLKENTLLRIIIKGEEDLLTLPAILLAPIGAVVIYGQYEVGLIVVKVDLTVKKKVVDILNKFI